MIIKESKEKQAEGMIDKLYPILLEGLSKATEEKRQKELLDTWSEILQKFGLLILRSKSSHIKKDDLMTAIFRQLISGTTAEVKAQASKCMGAFAVILTKEQLLNLTNKLLS